MKEKDYLILDKQIAILKNMINKLTIERNGIGKKYQQLKRMYDIQERQLRIAERERQQLMKNVVDLERRLQIYEG